ncbi:MAG: ribosome maturation factor RimP [Pseudomonadota bacterium]
MTPIEETISALIAPVVDAEGFELVRVRVSGAKNLTLQIMAERPDKTMTAEDCARLSRALSPVLEEADPIEGKYALEVSSPGIDRPLTRFSDYADWEGYEAKIELNRLVEGRKRLRGVLAGVEEASVLFDIDGEDETAMIPFDWIAGGKLVLTDQLIAESLKAAKAASVDDETMETTHEPS